MIHNETLQRRLTLVGIGLIAISAILLVRLISFQFRMDPQIKQTFASQAENRYNQTVEVMPNRGQIFDRNGHLLAGNSFEYRIGISPNQVVDRQETVAQLAPLVGMSEDQLYRRLLPTAPAGYVFCIDGFVGASPELLVSRIDDTVRAQPMAGTLPRSGDPKVDMGHAGELLRSDKLRHEHEVTILRAHDALLGWCSYLDAQPEPQVVEAGAVEVVAPRGLGHMEAGRPAHDAKSVTRIALVIHPVDHPGVALIGDISSDPTLDRHSVPGVQVVTGGYYRSAAIADEGIAIDPWGARGLEHDSAVAPARVV